MDTNITKAVIVTVLSTFFSGFWALIIPLVLLIVCEIVDYATGIAAADSRGQEVRSEKSYAGIKKKVSMLLLVLVGAMIDLLLLYCSAVMGFELPAICNFLFACLISLWLICNELISITENLRDMGAPIPVFLLPVLNLIKKKAEESVKVEDQDSNK